jgi:hypothetical protein
MATELQTFISIVGIILVTFALIKTIRDFIDQE